MQVLNLLIASLGSAMSLVVLVVALIYAIYIPDVPRLAQDMPDLLISAALLAVIGAVGWLAVWARAGMRSFRLPAEFAMIGVSALGCLGLVAVLSGAV